MEIEPFVVKLILVIVAVTVVVAVKKSDFSHSKMAVDKGATS